MKAKWEKAESASEVYELWAGITCLGLIRRTAFGWRATVWPVGEPKVGFLPTKGKAQAWVRRNQPCG